MGSKKRKSNVASSSGTPPLPVPPQDDTLVDDLLAQLDNPDPVVQQEAAYVIQEVESVTTRPTVDPPKTPAAS